MEPSFEVMHTIKLKGIEKFRNVVRKKEELEKKISSMIRDFEDETGVGVDILKYQRDLTLPLKKKDYITLHIKLSDEELENW